MTTAPKVGNDGVGLRNGDPYLRSVSLLPPTLPTFVPNDRYTLAQWEAIEQSTGKRYEYHDGFLVSVEAMAGGSVRHSLLGGHAIRELGNAIIAQQATRPGLSGCDAHSSDLRIAVAGGKRYLYADAVVVCGAPSYDDAIPSAITNPVVVAEVLLPSSEGYDRGLKFDYYGGLDSLREYVIVHQDERRVEVRSRADAAAEWRYATVRDVDAAVVLPALGASLPLAGLYRNWERGEG